MAGTVNGELKVKKDWEIKKLGDVCEEIYAGGDKPALFSQEQTEDYKIPIYANGITNDGLYGFTKEATEDRECLTISARGTIGFVCVRNKPFVPIVRLIILVPKQNVYIHYLKYYCQILSISNTGSSIPQLTVPMIKTYSVMIPPLEEQKRIVKILDEKFAQLETIKTNAQTNLQNAKDLFQSQLTKAFSNTTWEKKTIGDICLLKSGNSSSNNSKPGNLPYVKVGDMTINGNERTITTSTLFVDYEENKKNIFPKGTVIFPKRGGAILTNKKRLTAVEICCDLNIMGVIPTDKILSEFLYYYFIGIDFAELCNGAAIPQINNIDINPLTISLPPLPEQKRIVKELDTLSEKVKALQNIYEQMLLDCEELKQSFLCKAFEGEL